MTTTNGIDVLHAILTDARTGDDWYDAIGPLFDIAEALYRRDESIPDQWQYRPGLGLATEDEAREDSYVLDMILSAVDHGDCTWEDVRGVGNALDERCDVLRAAGRDY